MSATWIQQSQKTPIYILTAHDETSFPKQSDAFKLAQGIVQKPLNDEKCAEIFNSIER